MGTASLLFLHSWLLSCGFVHLLAFFSTMEKEHSPWLCMKIFSYLLSYKNQTEKSQILLKILTVFFMHSKL